MKKYKSILVGAVLVLSLSGCDALIPRPYPPQPNTISPDMAAILATPEMVVPNCNTNPPPSPSWLAAKRRENAAVVLAVRSEFFGNLSGIQEAGREAALAQHAEAVAGGEPGQACRDAISTAIRSNNARQSALDEQGIIDNCMDDYKEAEWYNRKLPPNDCVHGHEFSQQ